jgi:hypothetical protein
MFQANGPPKQAGVATFMSDKVVRRDKGHLILIKGTKHHEDTAIVNMYAPNVSESNFIEQMLSNFKAQIDPQHNDSGRLQYISR